jgi:hypothetical protein
MGGGGGAAKDLNTSYLLGVASAIPSAAHLLGSPSFKALSYVGCPFVNEETQALPCNTTKGLQCWAGRLRGARKEETTNLLWSRAPSKQGHPCNERFWATPPTLSALLLAPPPILLLITTHPVVIFG